MYIKYTQYTRVCILVCVCIYITLAKCNYLKELTGLVKIRIYIHRIIVYSNCV